jgi:asparagine synthase (glutamine-hydrolysing)
LRVWPETQFIPALYDSPDKFFVRRDKLFSDIDTSKMSLCDRLRVADVNHYLPGSVLAKVDRMSMRHGLEEERLSLVSK